MIIFLYGQDNYRSRKKLTEIIGRYQEVNKNSLNLRYIDCQSISFSSFEDELKQKSMFKEKRLFVLSDVFLNSNFRKELLAKKKFILSLKDMLIFYEDKDFSKKDAFFNFLKKNSKFQEFNFLTESNLKKWTKKEIEDLGAKITEGALQKLVDFTGANLWQIANEINKLVNYKKKDQITEQDIELLVRPEIESDIFKTIEAIASRNKKLALNLIKGHLNKGDSPFYIFSMINFQFRNLLIVKDLLERNLSPFEAKSIHPFVIRKSLGLVNKFSISDLKKIYHQILEVDTGLKTGKISPETALDLFIVQV